MSQKAKGVFNYFNQRGQSQRGDEATECYSDGEGDEDSKETRRERRDAVVLLKAAESSVAHRATSISGLKNAKAALPTMVDNRGTVGIGFVNTGKLDETSMREARELDRALGTEATVQQFKYTDRDSQTQVTQVGVRVAFNAFKLLDDYYDSQLWCCNGITALILLTIGGFCIAYVIRNIYSYLF